MARASIFRLWGFVAACALVAALAGANPASACDTPLVITDPTVVTTPDDCVVIDGSAINGDVVIDTTIDNPTPNDPAVSITNTTITGQFVTNGLLQTSTGSSGLTVVTSTITGGIVNTGDILATALGVSLAADISGGMTNTGTISGNGGIDMSGAFSGDLTNSGSIIGTGAIGLFMSANWNGGLNNSGTITGATLAGVWFANILTGGVENSGDINGGIYGIRNQGLLDNGILNSGDIVGGTFGVAATEGVITGGITNQADGRIIGTTFLGITVGQDFSGGITNAGEIRGATFGVFVNDLFAGGISNSGLISGAGDTGIVLANTAVFQGGISNANGALITGGTGIEVRGGAVLNGGIQNAGQIIGTDNYGIFMNGGATLADGIQNSNIITGAFTGVILDGDFSGGVTNASTGTIIGNQGFGLLSLGGFNGGIDNAGSIIGLGVLAEPQGSDPFNSVDGGIGVLITGPTFDTGVWVGTFLNRASGVIDATYIGVKMLGASFSGEFRNAGQIVGGDPGDLTGFGYSFGASLSYVNFEGDIVNEATGAIVASSPNAGVPGYNFPNAGLEVGLFAPLDSLVKVSTFQGNVVNNGFIGGPTGLAMFLNVFDGGILNGAGALIDGVNGNGILMDVTTWTGSLSNNGQIRSANAVGIEALGNANGVAISNGAAGRIEGQTAAIRFSGSLFTGSIVNAGLIQGGADGVNVTGGFAGDIQNTGLIAGGSGAGLSVGALGVFDGTLTNSGSMTGGLGAVLNTGAMTGGILNTSTGSLTGGFWGVILFDGTFNGGITNAGSISGSNAGILSGGVFTDGINNSGSISGTAFGIRMSNASTFSGGIANTGTGVISASLIAAISLENVSSGDIVNAGTVSGPTAIQILNTFNGGIFNSGIIAGSINLEAVTTPLTYRQTGAGAVTAASTFALSDTAVTTLDFRGGTLLGDVAGGADLNDIFEVNAGGNIFGYSSGTASNLASFAVNSGTAFIGDAAINTNAMSVGAGATLFLSESAVINAANVTFSPTSSFQAALTTNTAVHPTINVDGTANLAGAFVAHIDPQAFLGSGETEWVYDGIIAGDVTGAFNSVTIFGAPNLFSITPAYNSFDVTISLNSFAELIEPTNPNQVSVGDALDDIYQDGTTDPDLLNLIDTLANASPDEIADILDAIAGSTNAETGMAAMRQDDPWKQSVGQRVNAARSTGCTVAGDTWCFRRYAQVQAPSPVISDATDDAEAFGWLETGLRDVGATSLWGRIVGIWGETDGGASSPGSQQRTYGLVGGVDHVVDQTLLLGVAGQYVNTQADFERSFNESSVESVQVGPYFSYGGAEAYLNGNASIIFSRSLTDRFFAVGNQFYAASVRFPSTTYTASLEGGTIFEVGGYRLEPNIGVNYALQATDRYAEEGAGGLGLIVDPEDLNSLRSLVGGRVSRVYDIGDRKIVPELRVEWRHEFLDRRHTFEAAFAGAPDVTFLVSCEPSARDVFALGGSLTIPVAGRVTGFVDAEGAFSEDSRAGTLSLGARATW
jgi:hypothetical protein